MTEIRPVLGGQEALALGIANDHSIAHGCAKAYREAGADLAEIWLNEKAACRTAGGQGIRAHAISSGPLKTRAASGLKAFELLLNEAVEKGTGFAYGSANFRA